MTKRNTSIQLNGKYYDAITGDLLAMERTQSKPITKATVVPHVVTVKPLVESKPVASKLDTPKPRTVARTAAQHAAAKKVTPSKTLMRHAVSKPQPSLKRTAHAQTATHHAAHVAHTSRVVVIPKTSLKGTNHVRASRASQHQLNPRVSKFHKEVNLVAASVKADFVQAVNAIDNAVVIPQTYSQQGPYRPDIRRVRVVNKTSQPTSDIFEQALQRATSHEQPEYELPKGSRLRALRRRMVSFTAGAVAVLAIVGFFGYQKQDSIKFQASASRAGISSATMPGYQPKGYALQKIHSSNGYMYVQYANADKNYTVSQRQTTWSTQTLLDRIAANSGNEAYGTLEVNGRVVYMYGRNQAAWIHNGVLYQVLGNGVLSSQDFTKLASSM